MFERFTEDARVVVVGANEHASRLGHHWIGCEHLLLALASADDLVGEALRDAGVTAAAVESTILGRTGPGRGPFDDLDREALAAVGIDVDAVREAVEQSFGAGALDRARRSRQASRRFPPWRRARRTSTGHVPFTPRAKDCLAGAQKEALRGGYVGAEHVALSALSMKHSPVPNILAAIGVSGDALRADITNRYRKAS